MVSAEIAVAMAVPIENPADCEVRSVIRFVVVIGGFTTLFNISGH